MGQYWKIVNLDRREFLMPHKLASGLKLWEIMAAKWPGVALIPLLAAMPEPRGGGDLDLDENWHGKERTFPKHNSTPGPMPKDYQDIAHAVIGRWAGNRIAIVGDYAEDGDLAPEHSASAIYSLCLEYGKSDGNFERGVSEHIEHLTELEEECRAQNNPARADEFRARRKSLERQRGKGPYRDISDLVCRVIEHELQVKFQDEGWRKVVDLNAKAES